MRFGSKSSVRGGVILVAFLLAATVTRADRLTQHWKEGLRVIEETKFTPAKAIAAAEDKSKGKAVSIHYVVLKSGFSMWVHCFADEKCWVVPVDPKNGKAAEMKAGVPADMSCPTASEACRLMDEAKLSLTKAIENAEAYSKGTVLAAKTEVKEGVLTIILTSAVGEKLMIVTMDGKTGQVTKMEEDKQAAPKGG